MVAELRNMSGEQLLLVSVLGEPKVQDLVDQELDRRAVLGRPKRLSRRNYWTHPEPRRAA